MRKVSESELLRRDKAEERARYEALLRAIAINARTYASKPPHPATYGLNRR